MKLREKLLHHFHEIIQIKKSPHSIALGFAIGTFISILPTPGFNILLGIVVVLIFKNVNKFSLFGAMALFNPLVLTPLYILSYSLGDLFFASQPIVEYDVTLLDQIYHFSRRFLVGNIIIACFTAITGYMVTKFIAQRYQKR